MAENDITLSDLNAATDLPAGTLFYVIIENQESETGYDSFKINSELVASKILSAYNFPLLLDTTAKNAIGAINELNARPTYKELTGTLTAGQTSITISDAAILTTSTIDIYTDVFGVSPEDVTVSNGSVTMTFSAQSANLSVKLRVS